MHKLIQSCQQDFYKAAREHGAWKAVQNVVDEYLTQKGMWLDGHLLKKSKDLSMEAYCGGLLGRYCHALQLARLSRPSWWTY